MVAPDPRKRGPGGTLQARIFLAMRMASGTATFYAELLGHQRETTRKAISYLIARGYVTKHAIRHRLVIYAAVLGRHVPSDRRGKPPGCRNHRGQNAYAKWLLMMRAKHGPTWRPRPRGHALDQAWHGFNQFDRTTDVRGRDVSHR